MKLLTKAEALKIYGGIKLCNSQFVVICQNTAKVFHYGYTTVQNLIIKNKITTFVNETNFIKYKTENFKIKSIYFSKCAYVKDKEKQMLDILYGLAL